MDYTTRSPFQILEIGDNDFFFSLAPELTTRVCTHVTQRYSDNPRRIPFRLSSLAGLLKRIKGKEFDLIVIHPTSATFRRLFKCFTKIHALGPYLIFLAETRGVPIVVCDLIDTMVIPRKNFLFFHKAVLYFKRELPQNNWQAFLFTTQRNEDVTNIRQQPFFQQAHQKLRPFPLNAYRSLDFRPIEKAQKTMDIFYIGENPKTTVRLRGMQLMQRLKTQGLRIDLPEERLTPQEYRARIARAWLVWSPEGSGWECARHHESIIEGAVPVMNYPTIDRYKPLIEGKHAFYYGCEEDDLERVIKQALSNTSRLLEMVQAGREHLRQWYTKDAILDYVWREISFAQTRINRTSITPKSTE